MDNVAAMARSAERHVAKLHEANIPVTPASTGPYNVDHAYGTAEYATEFVRRMEAVGVDEVQCLIQMGTVPQEVWHGDHPAVGREDHSALPLSGPLHSGAPAPAEFGGCPSGEG